MKKKLVISIFIVMLSVAVGCGKEEVAIVEIPAVEVPIVEISQEEVPILESSEQEEDKIEEIDFEKIKPNEIGEIMVIMYHTLGKNSDYGRSVESFKGDIQRLYDMKFRAISLKDFVNNEINVEAGCTPVVLTFDDGHKSNFWVEEVDGKIIVDPNSAIGILEDFYKNNPDFGLEATFFLNGGIPFGQKDYVDYKLNYIVENGMDIGNHSYGHEHLKDLSADKIQETLGKNIKNLNKIVPNYEVNLLALPFGQRPKDERNEFIANGMYEGQEYKNIAILKVGWKPEVSSVNKKFDFESINRVQSGDEKFQLKYYLDEYEKKSDNRFISDGNPNIVTIPEESLENLDVEKLNGKELRTY